MLRLISLLMQQSLTEALSAQIQASPNTVGASNSLLILALGIKETIPIGGGLQIASPVEFSQRNFSCTVFEPLQLAEIAACEISSTAKQARVIFKKASIEAGTEIYMQLHGAANPPSTAKNRGYRVRSFDQQSQTIEAAEGLSILNLQPAVLNDFKISPESQELGATTAVNLSIKVDQTLPCKNDRSGCAISVSNPLVNPRSAEATTVFQS